MGSRRSRQRANRRDRRKARQSNFSREGTKNPRKVGHHLYLSHDADLPQNVGKRRTTAAKPKKAGKPYVLDKEFMQLYLQSMQQEKDQPG